MAWDVNELARRIDPRRGGGVIVYGIIVVAVLYAGLSQAWRTGWAEMQAQTDAQCAAGRRSTGRKAATAQRAAQATVRLHQHCQQYPADYRCETMHGKSLDEVLEMQRKQREAIQ
jgi:hypothetical protein